MNGKQISGGSFIRRISNLFFALAVLSVFVFQTQAATISPTLQKKLTAAADNVQIGTVLVAFKTTGGLQESHLNILRGIGITSGKTFPNLGIVAATLTAGQIRLLNGNSAVRSIWSNDRIYLYLNQARILTGVDRLRVDAGMTLKNGGLPVSGAGDFSVPVIDSFPAEVRQTAPGQFQVFAGPRFEPNTTINRAALAVKLNKFKVLFTTGG